MLKLNSCLNLSLLEYRVKYLKLSLSYKHQESSQHMLLNAFLFFFFLNKPLIKFVNYTLEIRAKSIIPDHRFYCETMK